MAIKNPSLKRGTTVFHYCINYAPTVASMDGLSAKRMVLVEDVIWITGKTRAHFAVACRQVILSALPSHGTVTTRGIHKNKFDPIKKKTFPHDALFLNTCYSTFSLRFQKTDIYAENGRK